MISLADNKISSIDKHAFLWTNLLQLDLSGNSLKSLPPSSFFPVVKSLLSNHGALLIGDNPFSCQGCTDYEWILKNDRILSRMLINFECVGGSTIADLDYDLIGC